MESVKSDFFLSEFIIDTFYHVPQGDSKYIIWITVGYGTISNVILSSKCLAYTRLYET